MLKSEDLRLPRPGMVQEGAGSLSQRFQRLNVQNEQLRADVVQLRLRAAGATRRPNGRTSPQSRNWGSLCSTFASVGTWGQHDAAVPSICVAGSVVVACSWDGYLTSFDLASWREGPAIAVRTAGTAGEMALDSVR